MKGGIIDVSTITLSAGAHTSPEQGMCIMEAVAWMARLPFSDQPTCTSPLIGALLRPFNDRLKTNAERNRLLMPLIPLLIGTNTTSADETTRAYMAADWLIRQRAPAFLRVAGFTADAEVLENLARIVDAATARSATPVAREIRDRMWTTRTERWSALRAKLLKTFPADASAAIDASAASAAIAASAASAAIDASDASAAIAASAASAASAAIDASDASAASAAIDAIAASAAIDGPQSVHADALRAALAASQNTKGGSWTKQDAAYKAAREVYDARLGEWPLVTELKAEAARQNEKFVELIRALCAVGRVAAEMEVVS